MVRVIARLNLGGPAWHVVHLSRGLESRYPTVLVAGCVSEGEADLADYARRQGVRLVVIPELGRSIRPWDDLVAFVKLARLFRALRPVIVHTHTAKAGTLGRLAAVLTGVPIRVHTFHGHVFRGYFGSLASRCIVFVERALARLSDRVVTVSERLVDEIAGEFGVCGRERICAIPLGLELDRFHPTRSRPLRDGFRSEIGAGDGPVVTIVGRLEPVKNHHLFLEAAALVRAAGRRARFVIVGGGGEERRLRERTAALDLEEDVLFLGWRSDLDRVYAGSDLVVLTSVNEGTPVCLIEALAAGRPVVATDVGGVRDVVEDGRLGVVVPPGDPRALADAIVEFIDDPSECEARARGGPDVMPSRFGVERLLADTERLYDELLASKRQVIRARQGTEAARVGRTPAVAPGGGS